jgi:hypothetical protein
LLAVKLNFEVYPRQPKNEEGLDKKGGIAAALSVFEGWCGWIRDPAAAQAGLSIAS